MRRWHTSLHIVLLTLGLCGNLDAARAQSYPNRTITLVIPFPPGGSTSIVGRVIADKMSQLLGQSIVVDNRGGAGGTVGTKAVTKSDPDGYTLLLGYTGTLAIGPSLYRNVGYDPRKDFAPIGMIGNAPSSLVVHPSFAVKSVAELIAYAKANPGKLNFGSAGVGTVNHITGEYFARTAGITLVHVPYNVVMIVEVFFLQLLLAFAITAFGVMIAARIKQMQSFMGVMQMIVMPMFFISGALFPASGLPGWLTVLNRIDPLTYAVDPMRRLVFSHLHVNPLAKAALDPGVTWWGWRVPGLLEAGVILVLGLVMLSIAIWEFSSTE